MSELIKLFYQIYYLSKLKICNVSLVIMYYFYFKNNFCSWHSMNCPWTGQSLDKKNPFL